MIYFTTKTSTKLLSIWHLRLFSGEGTTRRVAPQTGEEAEYRRCGRSLCTAMPKAFFCPTSARSYIPFWMNWPAIVMP